MTSSSPHHAFHVVTSSSCLPSVSGHVQTVLVALKADAFIAGEVKPAVGGGGSCVIVSCRLSSCVRVGPSQVGRGLWVRAPPKALTPAPPLSLHRVGVLEDSFTFLGIFLAIVLFPFGFICCFALRKRRCPNCGANFT